MDTFDPKHIYSDAAKLARLKDKKLFLFDIDGTIAVGDTLYAGSADLLRYIQAINASAIPLTFPSRSRLFLDSGDIRC